MVNTTSNQSRITELRGLLVNYAEEMELMFKNETYADITADELNEIKSIAFSLLTITRIEPSRDLSDINAILIKIIASCNAAHDCLIAFHLVKYYEILLDDFWSSLSNFVIFQRDLNGL
mgnify:CR=1 FL=1